MIISQLKVAVGSFPSCFPSSLRWMNNFPMNQVGLPPQHLKSPLRWPLPCMKRCRSHGKNLFPSAFLFKGKVHKQSRYNALQESAFWSLWLSACINGTKPFLFFWSSCHSWLTAGKTELPVLLLKALFKMTFHFLWSPGQPHPLTFCLHVLVVSFFSSPVKMARQL